MGLHVAGDAPAIDRLVEDVIKGVGRDIADLHIPRLGGVVLGGGYGRGEGGVGQSGGLSNDLDFYVVTEDGAGEPDIAAISAALEPVSRRWTERLGIDVDFCIPKTPWRIIHDQERLMIQELVNGYFDVAGKKGAELFANVKRLKPSELPWLEAIRLLVNRGAGLLLALESNDNGFIVRNINKAVLGAGDAKLIARHEYRWKAEERAGSLGEDLYSRAVAWKFRPSASAVCDWDAARELWLGAVDFCFAADGAGKARNIYNLVRWIVRRRSIGDFRTLGQDPLLRILRRMRKAIVLRQHFPPSLKKDWQIFN